jgi:signal transduction histidine kinase
MKAHLNERIPLNLAIVGGGRTCAFFLDLISLNTFADLSIQVLAVCDVNPQAPGYLKAAAMGIPTTQNIDILLETPGLEVVIELTNDPQVLLNLVNKRPKRVGILEYNFGKFLRRFFSVDQKLQAAEQQVMLQKLISDFLIQQARQQIVILNRDLTISDANIAFFDAIEMERDAAIGTHCYHSIYGFDVPCADTPLGLACPMLETLRTGKSAHVVHSPNASEPDGGTAPKEIVTYPIHNAQGEIVRVIEVWRDLSPAISSRWVAREKELKADFNRLIAEDRLISMGKLVASCVHEINNPIQGLLTFCDMSAEMLARDDLSPKEMAELRNFNRIMLEELERCGRIVSGLLSFSRESKMAFVHIDLNDVVTAVVDLTRHRIGLQNIDLVVDLSPRHLMARGDANRLQQCLLNIVFNAIEAMPDGGRLTITTARVDDGERAAIRIQDSGPGIAAEEKAHIFEPFYTTKPPGEGTGLGLSIVYGVVMSHGGQIEIETPAGGGTAFILVFPLRVDSDEAEPVERGVDADQDAHHDRG